MWARWKGHDCCHSRLPAAGVDPLRGRIQHPDTGNMNVFHLVVARQVCTRRRVNNGNMLAIPIGYGTFWKQSYVWSGCSEVVS